MTRADSPAKAAEDFILDAERIVCEHCDPDNPSGWLVPSARRDAFSALRAAYESLHPLLLRQIGREAAGALTGAIFGRVDELVSYAGPGVTDRRKKQRLETLRYWYENSDLPLLFQQLREASGAPKPTVLRAGLPNPCARKFELTDAGRDYLNRHAAPGRRPPRAPEGAKLKKPRRPAQVKVSGDGKTLHVDGVPYRISGGHCAEFLRALLKKRGHPVTSTSLVKLGVRADREYRKLPAKVRDLIDKPGRGQTGYILR